jgi:hypothetical protein
VTAPFSRPVSLLRRLAWTGLALACIGCLSPALRAAEERPQLDSRTSDELTKFQAFQEAKNWDGALALLLNLQPTLNPTSFDNCFITMVVSKLYMQKGEYAKAREAMEVALRLSDTYDYLELRDVQELVYYLARVYNEEASTLKSAALQQQYLSKSIDYTKRWLEHNDKSPQDPQRQEMMLFYPNVLYNRAVINPAAIDVKGMKQCQVEIEHCLVTISHPRESFYVLLLASLQQQGNLARAAEVLEQLVAQYPAKKEYWVQLAPLYLNLAFDKNEEKAREYNIRAILTIERTQALGFMRTPKENFTLVGLYFNVGQFGKATELLYSGLKSGAIEPVQGNWELLAYSYQQVDKPYQAIDVLKEAAQRFPKSGQLNYQVAQIYYSLEKPEDAYRSLVTAVAKGGLEKPYAVYNFLAYVAYELTKYDEALVAVEKAIASPGAEREHQLPRLKQAIEEALKERAQLKAGIRTQ